MVLFRFFVEEKNFQLYGIRHYTRLFINVTIILGIHIYSNIHMHVLKTRLPPLSITSRCCRLSLLSMPLSTQARRWLATGTSLGKPVDEAPRHAAKKQAKKRVASSSSTTELTALKAATLTTATAVKRKTKKLIIDEALKEPAVKSTRRRNLASTTSVTPKSLTTTRAKSTTTSTTRRSHTTTNLLQPQKHYDFDSYLNFLEATGKSTATTVSTGTLYEYATIQALANLGFRNLVRCGKAGDNGVDVVGTCDASAVARTLLSSRGTGTTPQGRKPRLLQHMQTVFQTISQPSENAAVDREMELLSTPSSRPFNVIVQCKASEASVGSYLMREMAGSYFAFTSTALELRNAPAAAPTMVILVTAGGRLTSGAYKQLEASQMPMVYMYLEKPRCMGGPMKNYDPKSYRLGGISQVTPNQYAKELLKQHGLAFKIVRSYSLKPPVIVDQVGS